MISHLRKNKCTLVVGGHISRETIGLLDLRHNHFFCSFLLSISNTKMHCKKLKCDIVFNVMKKTFKVLRQAGTWIHLKKMMLLKNNLVGLQFFVKITKKCVKIKGLTQENESGYFYYFIYRLLYFWCYFIYFADSTKF